MHMPGYKDRPNATRVLVFGLFYSCNRLVCGVVGLAHSSSMERFVCWIFVGPSHFMLSCNEGRSCWRPSQAMLPWVRRPDSGISTVVALSPLLRPGASLSTGGRHSILFCSIFGPWPVESATGIIYQNGPILA